MLNSLSTQGRVEAEAVEHVGLEWLSCWRIGIWEEYFSGLAPNETLRPGLAALTMLASLSANYYQKIILGILNLES